MADESWRGWLPSDVINEADTPIHHYTDAGGLLGAVEKGQLWATEATGLNDLAEVKQGWQFIRDWAKDQDPKDRIIQKVIKSAGTEDGDDSAPARSRVGLFMCCASLRQDDANQWRLYGGGGRGYAMQLNPQTPLAVFADGERPKAVRRSPGGVWVPFESATVTPWLNVLYNDDEKTRALEGIRSAATEASVRAHFTHNFFDRRLAWELGRVAQLMKSDGFSGEHEVRVVVSDPEGLYAKFRATPHGVVRYVQLVTDPLGTSALVVFQKDSKTAPTIPLRSVTLGPLIHAQNNRSTIQALLEGKGYSSCDVRESTIPLGH